MKPIAPLAKVLEEDSGYGIFGAETLLSRARDLEAQVEGAKKGEDIEYVHKLRVASRRVRTALKIFEECFPERKIENWQEAIKGVTVSCGEARDTDVELAFLEDYSTHLDLRAARGVRFLIAQLKTRRTKMQMDVVRVLSSLQSSGVLEDIGESCAAIKDKEHLGSHGFKTIITYEKAYGHIRARLDEFLALGQFVHDSTAITKHHKLRIAAKRLRYTMEVFSSIYRDGLADQIALMRKFQDVLGEMHDTYVWAQNLASYRSQVPQEAKYGLSRLLAHLNEIGKSRYGSFVAFWDDATAKNLFAEIRRKTATGLNSEITRVLLGSAQRVALISDIHGNFDALDAVVRDAKHSGVEMFLNSGDAVGFGIYPSQVLQVLRSPVFLNVVGNVDLETVQTLRARENQDHVGTLPAEDGLSELDVSYLLSLPKELRMKIDGKRVLVTHGSPDSIDEHLYPDSPERRLKQISAKASADIIITGHTHQQMNRRIGGVTFVNPGSVGRPVDGDPRAEYAILNLNPLRVEFRQVSYDVENLADEMRKRTIPESDVQVLLRGRNLKTIKRQDRALAKKRLWKNRSTIKVVRKWASVFPSDHLHAEQDRKIALTIFDGMKRVHSLGAEERFWLECAAILHDVGLSPNKKGHHKTSLKMILNNAGLPFTHRERYAIGSIARYHRKALPSDEHYNLRPLSETEREKVSILSSILRIADALDASHRLVVKKVSLKLFPHHVVLECLFSDDNQLESQSVAKKKDLFERVFKKDLIVVWKSEKLIEEAHSPLLLESTGPRK